MKWNFNEMELTNDKLTSENQANTHQDPPKILCPTPPQNIITYVITHCYSRQNQLK